MSIVHQSWRYFGFNQAHDPVLEATRGGLSWENSINTDINLILETLENGTLVELRVSGSDDYKWCTGHIDEIVSITDLKISIMLDDIQDNGEYAGQHHVIDAKYLSTRLLMSLIRFVDTSDTEEARELMILGIHPAMISILECLA